MGVDETKREGLLQHIITAAGSGADITRALMAYARKQSMHPESIELGGFLKVQVPLISRTVGGSISLTLSMVDGFSKQSGGDLEIQSQADQFQTAGQLLELLGLLKSLSDRVYSVSLYEPAQIRLHSLLAKLLRGQSISKNNKHKNDIRAFAGWEF